MQQRKGVDLREAKDLLTLNFAAKKKKLVVRYCDDKGCFVVDTGIGNTEKPSIVNPDHPLSDSKYWLNCTVTVNKESCIVEDQQLTYGGEKSEVSKFTYTYEVGGGNVDLDISGCFCDFGKVTIDSNGKTHIFSPIMCNRGKCMDINSDKEADFDGVTIPYCPSLLQSIRSCGGVKLLVPWFKSMASRSNTHFQIITRLIDLLVEKDSMLFVQQNFFRAFSHLLTTVPKSIRSDTVVSSALRSLLRRKTETGREKVSKHSSLLSEIRRYIVNDYPLMTGFGLNEFYCKKFSKLRSAKCLKFQVFLAQVLSQRQVMDDMTSVIDVIGHFAREEGKLSEKKQRALIAFLQLTPSSQPFSEDKNIESNILAVFDKNSGFFSKEFPFEHFFRKNDPSWTTVALKFLFMCIESPKYDHENIDQGLTVALDVVDRFDEEAIDVLNHILFRADKFNWTFQYTGFYKLRSSIILPLLVKALSLSTQRQRCLDYLYLAMKREEFALAISMRVKLEIPGWILYILYLAMFDDQGKERGISAIVQLVPSTVDNMKELYVALLLASKVFSVKFYDVICIFIKEILALSMMNDNTEAWKLLFEIVLFVPTFTKREAQPVEHLDFVSYIQKLSELDCEYLSIEEFGSQERGSWPYAELFMSVIDRLAEVRYVPVNTDKIAGGLLGIILALGGETLVQKYAASLEKLNIQMGSGLRAASVYALHHFQTGAASTCLLTCVKNSKPLWANGERLFLFGKANERQKKVNNDCKQIRKTFETMIRDIFDGFKNREFWAKIERVRGQEIDRSNLNKARKNLEDRKAQYELTRRVNEKICHDLAEELETEMSGIWSEKAQIWHRKLAKATDQIGRHLLTSRNKNFRDHANATRDATSGRRASDNTVMKLRVIDEYAKNDEKNGENDDRNEESCDMITVSSIYNGKVSFGSAVVFQAKKAERFFSSANGETKKICRFPLASVTYVLWRRYRHEDHALEFFTDNGQSYFFNFASEMQRKTVLSKLETLNSKLKLKMKIQNCQAKDFFHGQKLTKKWKNGALSNYEYLYWVNMFAGRSFRDLTQYPVYPWVLSDYTSTAVNLGDEKIYRDLSKPIGTLNEQRLKMLIEARKELDEIDASLYRVHYSNPAYVLLYLVRCEPFTSLHIEFQNGYFDNPDRLFASIPSAWASVTSEALDLRELIPEFFSLPDFLINYEHYNFGTRQSGQVVDNVDLPPWAAKPATFIVINRLALESPYVSNHLHEWIDLIFGEKAYEKRKSAQNDFHPSSYWQSISDQKDEELRKEMQLKAMNFGITPTQIFSDAHPKRKVQFDSWNDKEFKLTVIRHPESLTEGCRNPLYITWDQDDVILFSLPLCYARSKPGEKFDRKKIQSHINELGHLERKHFAYNADRKIAVVSAPWLKTFQCIKIDKMMKVESEMKPQQFHGCITCMSIGEGPELVVAIGTQDAVVSIVRGNERISLLGHTQAIIDICVSQQMDLVASIDIEYLVISSMSTGTMVTLVKLTEVPKSVLLSHLGLVVVIYDSRIETLDLSGRPVHRWPESSKDLQPVKYCQILRFEDHSEFLLVALEKRLWMLRIYDLRPVCSQCEDAKNIIVASFNTEKKRVAAIMENQDDKTGQSVTFCEIQLEAVQK